MALIGHPFGRSGAVPQDAVQTHLSTVPSWTCRALHSETQGFSSHMLPQEQWKASGSTVLVVVVVDEEEVKVEVDDEVRVEDVDVGGVVEVVVRQDGGSPTHMHVYTTGSPTWPSGQPTKQFSPKRKPAHPSKL